MACLSSGAPNKIETATSSTANEFSVQSGKIAPAPENLDESEKAFGKVDSIHSVESSAAEIPFGKHDSRASDMADVKNP